LQTLVARSADPLKSAVISVTRFQAGTAYNVIPADATLAGTVRTFDPKLQDMIEAGIARIATGVAEALGATALVEYRRGYPATVNHAREAALAAEIADKVVGAEQVERDPAPVMGAEDFAFMLERRPGCYIWLGQGGGPSKAMVHNPGYDFNDAVLPIGASWFANLVETLMPR
jgi:amidohydrolase